MSFTNFMMRKMFFKVIMIKKTWYGFVAKSKYSQGHRGCKQYVYVCSGENKIDEIAIKSQDWKWNDEMKDQQIFMEEKKYIFYVNKK